MLTSLKFWSVIEPNAVFGSIYSRPHAGDKALLLYYNF